MAKRKRALRQLYAEALESRRVLAGFPFAVSPSEELDITTDGAGNVYYSFSSNNGGTTSVDLDPGPNEARFDGAFVAKYTADGDFLWARGIQDTGSTGGTSGKGKKGGGGTTTPPVAARAGAVAADSQGNLYLSAYLSGTGVIAGVNAGNTPYSSSVTINGVSNALLIAKFDASGILQWHHVIEGASARVVYWGGIAIHESGGITDGVFIGHSFAGTVDFDPSPTVANLTSAGSNDGYILKLGGQGAYQWAIRMGSIDDDFTSAISVSPSGTVFATGGFNGENPFGSNYPLTSRGGQDGWVAEINGNTGQVAWASGFGGPDLDAGRDIVAQDDYVAIAGNFGGSNAIFGSEEFNSAGALDAFASKLDRNGIFLWTNTYGDAGNNHGWGLAVDGADNVYIGGMLSYTMDFDRSSEIYDLTSSNAASNAFVTRVDSAGNFTWATQL
ncbi:MAG: hypothetical protein KDB03_19340 [Planctomycetales bacterium]|nr:hypothetical protein [Planctomycetales bacterium]